MIFFLLKTCNWKSLTTGFFFDFLVQKEVPSGLQSDRSASVLYGLLLFLKRVLDDAFGHTDVRFPEGYFLVIIVYTYTYINNST